MLERLTNRLKFVLYLPMSLTVLAILGATQSLLAIFYTAFLQLKSQSHHSICTNESAFIHYIISYSVEVRLST